MEKISEKGLFAKKKKKKLVKIFKNTEWALIIYHG